MENNRPTYEQYKALVDNHIASGNLDEEQAIILLKTYMRSLEGSPVNINFLMSISGLTWKQINWTLNGLVLRKAIKRVDKNWYTI